MDNILEQMAEQFEEDIKDTKLNTEKIPIDNILRDNESTIRRNEKNIAFVLDGGSSTSADEFFKKSEKSGTKSEILDKDGKPINDKKDKSSSYSSTRSSYYSGSTSRTSEEREKEKARAEREKVRKETMEFTKGILKSCTESALTDAKFVAGTKTDWDIFEMQKIDSRNKTPKGKERVKKAKKKIKHFRSMCEFAMNMMGSTYYSHRKDMWKDDDRFFY